MTASSKWRAALVATAASAALAAVPVVGAQPAHAQPYPPPAPGLTLTSAVAAPGDPLGFTGTGFEEGQDVEAALFSSKVVLGHFTADEAGIVEGTVTIPEDTEPGKHLFRLKAEDPDRVLKAEIKVLPDKPHLARTGEDNNSSVLLGGAAGLVLLGGGAVIAARRLKRH
ncbi:LPXTG cell wall anchor domain-containing protein [Streptomyces sp. NPDC048825]|uniref:LPXTG cell wall anchor domain-containing protein n=1 Tax=Streptomyces sp. NPDC048825 TaxID=3365592 RepID=UPI003719EC19